MQFSNSLSSLEDMYQITSNFTRATKGFTLLVICVCRGMDIQMVMMVSRSTSLVQTEKSQHLCADLHVPKMIDPNDFP